MRINGVVMLLLAWVCCTFCFKDTPLTWRPSSEGTFSQFLQMRVMLFVTKDLNRSALHVLSTPNKHLKNTTVSLCDIFVLPERVSCASPSPQDIEPNGTTHCRAFSIKLRHAYFHSHYDQSRTLIVNNMTHACFNMVSPFLGGQTRRDAFLRATSFVPPLRFTKPMADHFRNYKRHLLGDATKQYTVVHWRRGDQLTTRCAQGKDISVNCHSVADLVAEVRKYTNDSVVYIATNAHEMSPLDIYTIGKAGFQLFDPFFAGYGARGVEALAVDAQLMVDATTFLGWGVSLINDLVEHARMLHRRSWCTTAEQNVSYPTWCWLQQQRLQKARPEHFHLLSASARRDILLQEDTHMRTHPLVLSGYNISHMPIYQYEILDSARRMANLFN